MHITEEPSAADWSLFQFRRHASEVRRSEFGVRRIAFALTLGHTIFLHRMWATRSALFVARRKDRKPSVDGACSPFRSKIRSSEKFIAFVTHTAEIRRILKKIGWPTEPHDFDPPYNLINWDFCQLTPETKDGFPEIEIQCHWEASTLSS